jgi:peptide/nickel transport system permease protein
MTKYPIAIIAAFVILLYVLAGIYAPLLTSGKAIVAVYDGHLYFPLFRFLFFQGYFTKVIDLFFNILMFTFPIMILGFINRSFFYFGLAAQIIAFIFLLISPIKDPNTDPNLVLKRKESKGISSLDILSDQAKVDLLIDHRRLREHHLRLKGYLPESLLYTPFQIKADILSKDPEGLKALDQWFKENDAKLTFVLFPFFKEFHWEEDAGGDERMNRQLPWWELTRINHKDLISALIFGIRISLTVGILSILISLAIAIPVGAIAGYYAGFTDIVVSRILEIWEGMPTFFMLLLIVAITQSKSIFLIISVIGLFGWTSFSRYIRGEFFKERNLPYVEAGKVFGFSDSYLIYKHILPNAIAPLVTLLPFAILGAISAEAGLSFLGLGEENTPSWGTLMDEGRNAFPGQSYLLWPPAILLTVLLVSIALIGDALRDYLDPRLS